MKDLKSGLNKGGKSQNNMQQQQNNMNIDGIIPDEIKKQYGNKSSSELLNELKREYQNGNFNANELKALINRISPMLDERAKQTLREIMKITER
ncbi:MAG: hypothetical protein RRY79_04015 [Clostridia bacterium]